jgi:TPR repeat protein
MNYSVFGSRRYKLLLLPLLLSGAISAAAQSTDDGDAPRGRLGVPPVGTGSSISASTEILQRGLDAYRSGRFDDAERLLTAAGNEGSVKAQSLLGTMYLKGRGISKDSVKARKWFELAAAQQDPEAAYNLGVIHYNIYGSLRDQRKALHYFEIAAAQGNELAKENVRQLHFRGIK